MRKPFKLLGKKKAQVTAPAPKARQSLVFSLTAPEQSTSSWRLHRFDLKPRAEERA